MPTAVRPRRSALYMPAANARAIEKARELPCDVVILDLEDAVAPEAKGIAREQAAAAVKAGGFGRREVVIRVNGLDTPWGSDDLAMARGAGADAVLVPKVSATSDLAAYRASLGNAAPLWAMIETCAGIMHLRGLAEAAPHQGVGAWIMGTNDLAKEMRCRLDLERAPLVPALSMAVIAARSQGLAILDGVYNDLENDDGLARQCAQGVAFGFDGKSLIHPRQVAIANTTFSPSPEDVAWSRAIIAAFALPENAGKGALRLEGRMVERLHLVEAERLIAVWAGINS
jgi:citrate lyase subunit beta/citryl-CoA lyase